MPPVIVWTDVGIDALQEMRVKKTGPKTGFSDRTLITSKPMPKLLLPKLQEPKLPVPKLQEPKLLVPKRPKELQEPKLLELGLLLELG